MRDRSGRMIRNRRVNVQTRATRGEYQQWKNGHGRLSPYTLSLVPDGRGGLRAGGRRGGRGPASKAARDVVDKAKERKDGERKPANSRETDRVPQPGKERWGRAEGGPAMGWDEGGRSERREWEHERSGYLGWGGRRKRRRQSRAGVPWRLEPDPGSSSRHQRRVTTDTKLRAVEQGGRRPGTPAIPSSTDGQAHLTGRPGRSVHCGALRACSCAW